MPHVCCRIAALSSHAISEGVLGADSVHDRSRSGVLEWLMRNCRL